MSLNAARASSGRSLAVSGIEPKIIPLITSSDPSRDNDVMRIISRLSTSKIFMAGGGGDGKVAVPGELSLPSL
jgi:hypothetical protein